jgi:uncharacterized protein YutE (UPF0331/DUF86 family)
VNRHDETNRSNDDSLQSFFKFLSYVTSSSARTFRLLALIWVAGLLIAGILALLTFVIGNFRTTTNTSPSWTAGLGVLGGITLTTLTSLIARRSRSASRRREGSNEAARLAAEKRFIESMTKLETAATGTVSDRVGERPDAIPLGIILRELEDEDIWSEDDVAYFRHLLRVRNSLVHDRDILDAAKLQSETTAAKRLMEILRRDNLVSAVAEEEEE